MRDRFWKNRFKITLALLLVLLLALIRIFEHAMFYDPLAYYFEGDYLRLTFPEFDGWKLFFNMTGRYALNTVLSLGILFVLFRDVKMLRFSALLYFIFFVLLMTAFFALVNFAGNEQNFMIFYVRRFLIQPIFVLLFIPAFYYQRRIAKNNIP